MTSNPSPRAPRWSLLTKHAQLLAFVAHRPDARLKDIAHHLGTTERTALTVLSELEEAGVLERSRDGRRNRYRVQAPASGPVLDAVVDDLQQLRTVFAALPAPARVSPLAS